MLAPLTHEQAWELTYYTTIEPFGEERQDLRTAHLLRWYYNCKRGNRGRDLTLGELTLYTDMQEAAAESDGRQELESLLSNFATRTH